MLVNIERALQIEGWMGAGELAWLAEQACTRRSIVEVGCWMGRSTRALADNTLGKVVAVDTFVGSEEHKASLKGYSRDYLWYWFHRNLLGCDNVRALRTNSVEAARQLSGQHTFDMVFLDGAHDYASVRADILAWRPLLAPGGLLCGHDYPSWEGVKRAVDELVENPRRGPGEIWYQKT
jgi:predicted O-methyltransferase YrrM